MDTLFKCPACGTSLAPTAPKGLCPRCALQGALTLHREEAEAPDNPPAPEPASPNATADPVSTRFGDYELLEEIARGGMGVVYKARQTRLNRIVAIKMILAGPWATRDFVRRFRVEAGAAAALQHPNIVAIHDVGVHDGRHFFSMDYIEGRSLTELVGTRPLPALRAARCVKIIAEAIHYAHEQGVLHRDLKPSNVLMDENDQPHVTDFGLAKRLDGNSSLTVTGHLLGSPNFMPPEQALGHRGKAGRQSDVYGLGAILYFLLTARPPFLAESLEETVARVLDDEPVSPRLLNPGVPRDLETICMKCLEKEPARRYRTALDVADELERFCGNESILGRPVTRPERVWRWCLRKPALAAALASVAVLLGIVALGSPIAAYRLDRARQAEEAIRLRAEQNLYLVKLNLAQQAWEENHLERVRQLLDETAGYPDRGFEWYYWQGQLRTEFRTLRGHIEEVCAAAITPDGSLSVTAGANRIAKMWETKSGRELRGLPGHKAGILTVAISLDGSRMITAGIDKMVKLWDLSTHSELQTFRGHGGVIQACAFFPDGRRFITGSRDGTAKIWEAGREDSLLTLEGHTNTVMSVAVSPDGRHVATASIDRTARLWDASNGRELRIFQGHTGDVRSVDFSANGDRLLTAGMDGTARVWKLGPHLDEEPLVIVRALDAITCAVFSANGSTIFTANSDNRIREWDAETGKLRRVLTGHTGWIRSLAITTDGQHLVSASADATAKIWDTHSPGSPLTLGGHEERVLAVAFPAEGPWLLTGSLDGSAKRWSASSGDLRMELASHGRTVSSMAFSPDGQWMLTGSQDGSAMLRSMATGETTELKSLGAWISAVGFSPDGRRILIGRADGTASVWSRDPNARRVLIAGHAGVIHASVLSRDGQWILTGSSDGTARLWEAGTGKLRQTLEGAGSAVRSAAFSPDGRRVVTGHADGVARVWEVPGGILRLNLERHRGDVFSVAFSPDGRRIVTGSSDYTAKLWDADLGKEVLTFTGHSRAIRSVAFSPDGHWIATGSEDLTARVWEAATPEQVRAWQQEEASAAVRLEALRRERILEEEGARKKRARDEGAIKRWLLLAPLDDAGIEHEAQLRPSVGDWQSDRVWRRIDLEQDFIIDFDLLTGELSHSSLAYAVAYIHSETDQHGLLMHVGCHENAAVYLNGEAIYEIDDSVPYTIDKDEVANVRLKAGVNVLVLRVTSGRREWKASIRLSDAQDKPLQGIQVGFTPEFHGHAP
jgi:eukaryotic-like serine/threonine-protein kinase